MSKLSQIYESRMFTHGGNPYELDYERTVRYAEAHGMQNNPVLFGESVTHVKVRAPFAECEVWMEPQAKVEPKPLDLPTTSMMRDGHDAFKTKSKPKKKSL